jgi:hypothetical protein
VERLTAERDEAQAKCARIFKGLEGSCMSCEPVGVLNQQMEQHIKTLQAERDEARRERDSIRRTFCFIIASGNFNARDGNTAYRCGAEHVAELNHWRCFEENN